MINTPVHQNTENNLSLDQEAGLWIEDRAKLQVHPEIEDLAQSLIADHRTQGGTRIGNLISNLGQPQDTKVGQEVDLSLKVVIQGKISMIGKHQETDLEANLLILMKNEVED